MGSVLKGPSRLNRVLPVPPRAAAGAPTPELGRGSLTAWMERRGLQGTLPTPARADLRRLWAAAGVGMSAESGAWRGTAWHALLPPLLLPPVRPWQSTRPHGALPPRSPRCCRCCRSRGPASRECCPGGRACQRARGAGGTWPGAQQRARRRTGGDGGGRGGDCARARGGGLHDDAGRPDPGVVCAVRGARAAAVVGCASCVGGQGCATCEHPKCRVLLPSSVQSHVPDASRAPCSPGAVGEGHA